MKSPANSLNNRSSINPKQPGNHSKLHHIQLALAVFNLGDKRLRASQRFGQVGLSDAFSIRDTHTSARKVSCGWVHNRAANLTPIQPRQHTHQRIVLNDIVMEQCCGGMQPDQPIAESRQRLMPADNRPRLRPIGNLGEGHRQAE